jgi:histidyl-tRNA synthetase
MNEASKRFVAQTLNLLRDRGVKADMAYGDRALKGGMKAADKSGAKYSLVIGDDELASGKANLKDMKNGSTESITLDPIEVLVNHLKRR